MSTLLCGTIVMVMSGGQGNKPARLTRFLKLNVTSCVLFGSLHSTTRPSDRLEMPLGGTSLYRNSLLILRQNSSNAVVPYPASVFLPLCFVEHHLGHEELPP